MQEKCNPFSHGSITIETVDDVLCVECGKSVLIKCNHEGMLRTLGYTKDMRSTGTWCVNCGKVWRKSE